MEPYLAPYGKNQSIVLIPVENGGWIVEARHWYAPDKMPDTIGAFSNSSDMMAALAKALMPLNDVATKPEEAPHV